MSDYQKCRKSNSFYFSQVDKASTVNDKVRMSSAINGVPLKISKADGRKEVFQFTNLAEETGKSGIAQSV